MRSFGGSLVETVKREYESLFSHRSSRSHTVREAALLLSFYDKEGVCGSWMVRDFEGLLDAAGCLSAALLKQGVCGS